MIRRWTVSLTLIGLLVAAANCARDRAASQTEAPTTRTAEASTARQEATRAQSHIATTQPVTLFDGTNLAHFTHRDGQPVQWKLVEGGAVEVAGGGDIVSAEAFDDCQIHVEFMPPRLPPDVKGQDRGNSGVYVQGRYEVQALDSWGVDSGLGDCGAIYNIRKPDNNACKPPGEWQAYDITFRAPRFDKSGKKVENARISVVQNGVRIHRDVELPKPTQGGITEEESPGPGPLLLQDHGNPVRYRNVRVVPLPDAHLAAELEKDDDTPTTQATFAPQQFSDLAPGMLGAYYKDVKSLDELRDVKQPPFLVRVDKQIQFDGVEGQFYDTKLNNNFGVRWTGVLRIPKDGTYVLGTYCDDAARLYLGDVLLIDGTKKPEEKGKSIKVDLAAGDYPVRVEYQQGAGEAEMHFSWKVKGDWQDIPAENLFHVKSWTDDLAWDKDAWESISWDRAAWMRDFAPKYEKMDYGPMLAHTVKLDDEQTVNKGIVVRLGTGDEAAVLFDTELLRYAGGWTGGWLRLDGVAFNMRHGENLKPRGTLAFTTKPEAGWGVSTDFTDTRPQHLGNLPRQQAHFKGAYRNGEQVVLTYTVGNRTVYDMPGFTTRDGKPSFTRTIEVGTGDRDVWLNLAPNGQPTRVAARGEPTLLTVDMTSGTVRGQDANGSVVAPSILCKGGPARWPQVVKTRGTLGTGEKPYIVDTIEVPEENPWSAWMRFGGIDFFSDGRAALCTLSGDVWVVSGIDEKLESVSWKRFAAGLFQPLGLRIVDDQLYVLGRDQITRLHDLNNDGEADFYENFNNDCIVTSSFHEFALDLQTDAEGNFYFAKGGPVRPGGRGWQQITDHNGCVLKVSKDGSKFEVFATGVRAPNGMGASPTGLLTVADNEGTWTPTCRLSWVTKGAFLGVLDLAKRESPPYTYDPPICWLSHKEIDNSSGGQVWSGPNWGPLSNRMLHMSYGQCDLFLVMHEEVDGVPQGGVVKFPFSFDTGICRGRVNPKDGQVYLTGLKGWQTRGAKDGALHRVRYTGKPVAMPCDLKVGQGQITIGFSCALDEELATDKDSYAVEQWNYIWSSDYGSPEVTVDDPTKKGHDPVTVESVALAPDKKSVTLKIPTLRPVMQMKIQMKLESTDGTPVEYTIYNTINKIPGAGGTGAKPVASP